MAPFRTETASNWFPNGSFGFQYSGALNMKTIVEIPDVDLDGAARSTLAKTKKEAIVTA